MPTGPSLIYGGSAKNRQDKAKDIIENLDKKLLKKGHPDTILVSVKDKNSIGIDVVRKIVNFLSVKPYSSKYKAIIIEDAEKLTTQAQNAFLKTLEEPPIYSIIILEAKTEDSLLPTVISRCRRFNLKADKENNNKTGDISLKELCLLSIPEKLDLAEKISKKEKDVIIKIIENWVREERDVMVNDYNKKRAENINFLLSIKNDLEQTNVNTRLALEYLFIFLKN